MMELQYFRGLRDLYKPEIHGNGIYFATDTQEIIHNDLSFSGVLPKELEDIKNKAEDALKLIGAESVQAQINSAFNDFVNLTTSDNTVNTLKELVDYVAEHDIAQLILDVQDHETRLRMVEAGQEDLLSKIEKNAKAIAELPNEMDRKIETAFSWKNVN